MLFRIFVVVSLACFLGFTPSEAGGVKDTSISAITKANGRIAFAWDAPPLFRPHIFTINPDGTNVMQLTSGEDREFGPSWSPDGFKIVFGRLIASGTSKLYIMNIDGSNQVPITNGPHAAEPSWSPDGSRIAYLSAFLEHQLHIINPDGTDDRVLATRPGFGHSLGGPPAWSPDGKKIAFVATGDDRVRHIYVMNSDGTGQTPITNAAVADNYPAWSPDGAKIAFTRNNTLFTMSPDGSNQVPVANLNGQQIFSPVWSPDGQKLALQINSSPARGPNVFVVNADGTNLTPVTENTGLQIGNGLSWQTLHVAPTQNPTLLTEENSERAIALQSVTFARDPFSLTQNPVFGSDARTRIAVFAMNIDLQPGETFAAVTASAEDSQHIVRPLIVEYVGRVPNMGWLVQVNLVLSDQLAEGDVLISLTYHGVESNKAVIKVKP